MSNEVGAWAVFENDECTNTIMATPSVIEEFSQKYPDRFYILASLYGLEEGDAICIGDWREKQEDGRYKYFRNVETGISESGEIIYEKKELLQSKK